MFYAFNENTFCRFFGAENKETALYFELNYARVVQLHSSVRQALKYKAVLFYI